MGRVSYKLNVGAVVKFLLSDATFQDSNQAGVQWRATRTVPAAQWGVTRWRGRVIARREARASRSGNPAWFIQVRPETGRSATENGAVTGTQVWDDSVEGL